MLVVEEIGWLDEINPELYRGAKIVDAFERDGNFIIVLDNDMAIVWGDYWDYPESWSFKLVRWDTDKLVEGADRDE